MSDAQAVTVELLEEICQAFNRHDVEAIVDYFAEDGEWLMARGPEHPHGRRCVGRREIGEVLAARFRVIPDMRWEDTRHWVVGNKAFSEWIVRGTTTEGERLDYLGCDLWEFARGKLVKKDTYWKLVE